MTNMVSSSVEAYFVVRLQAWITSFHPPPPRCPSRHLLAAAPSGLHAPGLLPRLPCSRTASAAAQEAIVLQPHEGPGALPWRGAASRCARCGCMPGGGGGDARPSGRVIRQRSPVGRAEGYPTPHPFAAARPARAWLAGCVRDSNMGLVFGKRSSREADHPTGAGDWRARASNHPVGQGQSAVVG